MLGEASYGRKFVGGAALYKYEDEKPGLLTDEGQRMFIRGRDTVLLDLDVKDPVLMEKAMACFKTSSNWTQMACVDRMVEIGDLREIAREAEVAQHRVFVRAR